MTNAEFENKLAKLHLSKKDFANIVGMPYQTLMNWNLKGQTPTWVESWLTNYQKAQTLEEILGAIEPFVRERAQ